MAQPVLLQSDFSLGMKRDVSRDALTDRTVYNVRDLIPNNGAPLRKRGGMSQFVSRTTASGEEYVSMVAYAPFRSGARIAWQTAAPTGTPRIEVATLAGSNTDIGTITNYPSQPPVFYRDKLYLPDWLGQGQLLEMTSTPAVAISAGSPPTARLATVFKDHLILAGTRSAGTPANFQNRIWVSRGGDPTASAGTAAGGGWANLTAAAGPWVDASFDVTALASLRNMIIVFGEGACERILFDVAPGVVGSDISIQPLFQVGCAQPNSICLYNDSVIFANQNGVYQTDGNALKDLTEAGGMKRYWLETLASYVSQSPTSPHTGWTISSQVYRGYLFISVLNAGAFVDAFMVDLANDAWFRMAGDFRATMMAVTPLGGQNPHELYLAVRHNSNLTPRVYKASPIFTPSSSNRTDPQSIALSPTLDTPFYRGKFGRKRFRKIHAAYDLRDASTSAVMTMAFGTDPGDDFGSGSIPTFPESTAYARADREIKTDGDGIHLRITVDPCDDFKLYGLGGHILTGEESR